MTRSRRPVVRGCAPLLHIRIVQTRNFHNGRRGYPLLEVQRTAHETLRDTLRRVYPAWLWQVVGEGGRDDSLSCWLRRLVRVDQFTRSTTRSSHMRRAAGLPRPARVRRAARGRLTLPGAFTVRRPAPRRTRGQALVEFALIAPLFFLIIFGIIEFALINASIGTFNFAAKDAARTAAIIGSGAPPSSSGTTDLDGYIVNDVILPRVNGVVAAKMNSVEFYRASESGACLSGAIPNCAQYDMWQLVGGTWTSTNQGSSSSSTCPYNASSYPPGAAPPGITYWPAACRLDDLSDADYLGVRISFTYTYLTAFFATASPTVTLYAVSVQRVEPQQYGWHSSPSQSAVALASVERGSAFLGGVLQAVSSMTASVWDSRLVWRWWRGANAVARRRL